MCAILHVVTYFLSVNLLHMSLSLFFMCGTHSLLYIVMSAILRVVAYFLSVNLLHMSTVFVLYVWHPHFPLKE